MTGPSEKECEPGDGHVQCLKGSLHLEVEILKIQENSGIKPKKVARKVITVIIRGMVTDKKVADKDPNFILTYFYCVNFSGKFIFF
jgi:hypothetical protein